MTNGQSDVAQQHTNEEQLGKWFQDAYPTLFDLAASIAGIQDADMVLEAVTEQLPHSTATTQADFNKWIYEAVSRSARIAAQFTMLYLENQSVVFAAIHSALDTIDSAISSHDPEALEDLSAEAWRVVWAKLPDFVPGKAKSSTWVYQIAWYVASNYRRAVLRHMGWRPPKKDSESSELVTLIG